MSNIYKVLKGLVSQINNSIKKTPQTLTEGEKAQVRSNIGVNQPDWSQNDETSPDYIKNRTHYLQRMSDWFFIEGDRPTFHIDEEANTGSFDPSIIRQIYSEIGIDVYDGWKKEGSSIILTVGGETCTLRYEGNEGGTYFWSGRLSRGVLCINYDSTIKQYSVSIIMGYPESWGNEGPIIIEGIRVEYDGVVELSEEFIPKTIARVTDIPKTVDSWDDLGIVQKYVNFGSATEFQECACQLSIGDTVYFDVEIYKYKDPGTELLRKTTYTWVVDEIGFSNDDMRAWYDSGVLSFQIVNCNEYNRVTAYQPEIYSTIDTKYLPPVEIPVQEQGDWSQNDINSLTYVKNRTHFVVPEVIETIIDITTTDVYSDLSAGGTGWILGRVGTQYYVIVNDIKYKSTVEYGQQLLVYDDSQKLVCKIQVNEETSDTRTYILFENRGTYHVVIQEIISDEEVHRLDEKYLPESVVTEDEYITDEQFTILNNLLNGESEVTVNE